MTVTDNGSDPRLDLSPEEVLLLRQEEEPVVGRAVGGGPGPLLISSVLAVFAVGLFLMLNARRTAVDETSLVTPVVAASLSAPAPPLVLPPAQLVPASTTPSLISGVMVQPMPVPAAQPAPSYGPPPAFAPSAPRIDPAQRRRAPTVVVDLDYANPRSGGSVLGASAGMQAAGAPGGESGAASALAALTPAGAAAALMGAQPAGGASPGGVQRNSDEAFAERVGGSDGPDRAVATTLRNLGAVVPQGAMIPGVLETAINSDLPGYTRAIVSRDVRSFDGKHVLIPRGSRLIGQYKSAVALGQSRAFIIWTRVTRPDGVSIQIGSPGTDALGRGGLQGEVDRHFFARFGGSILLSVLNAGVNAVSDTPTTQIAIGSPGAAASAASSALQGNSVPPTIKVAQGEAIRIFVARDLDFSNVGPAR